MYKNFLQHLIDVGLSDKEARVYVAMLELGPASVQEISQRSDVNRATTYLMLDALKERGLVSSYEDAKKTVYVAETPKKLVDLIEQEARSIDEKREKVVFFVPELEALYRTQRNKPVVRFYEGEEGLRSLRDYLTRIKTTIFDSFYDLTASCWKLQNMTKTGGWAFLIRTRNTGRFMFQMKTWKCHFSGRRT